MLVAVGFFPAIRPIVCPALGLPLKQSEGSLWLGSFVDISGFDLRVLLLSDRLFASASSTWCIVPSSPTFGKTFSIYVMGSSASENQSQRYYRSIHQCQRT